MVLACLGFSGQGVAPSEYSAQAWSDHGLSTFQLLQEIYDGQNNVKRDDGFFGRFSGNDVRFLGHVNEQNSRLDACFDRLDRILCLNTWLLVVFILVLVVPQLWAWVA